MFSTLYARMGHNKIGSTIEQFIVYEIEVILDRILTNLDQNLESRAQKFPTLLFNCLAYALRNSPSNKFHYFRYSFLKQLVKLLISDDYRILSNEQSIGENILPLLANKYPLEITQADKDDESAQDNKIILLKLLYLGKKQLPELPLVLINIMQEKIGPWIRLCDSIFLVKSDLQRKLKLYEKTKSNLAPKDSDLTVFDDYCWDSESKSYQDYWNDYRSFLACFGKLNSLYTYIDEFLAATDAQMEQYISEIKILISEIEAATEVLNLVAEEPTKVEPLKPLALTAAELIATRGMMPLPTLALTSMQYFSMAISSGFVGLGKPAAINLTLEGLEIKFDNSTESVQRLLEFISQHSLHCESQRLHQASTLRFSDHAEIKVFINALKDHTMTRGAADFALSAEQCYKENGLNLSAIITSLTRRK